LPVSSLLRPACSDGCGDYVLLIAQRDFNLFKFFDRVVYGALGGFSFRERYAVNLTSLLVDKQQNNDAKTQLGHPSRVFERRIYDLLIKF